jgi:hypothetical protein
MINKLSLDFSFLFFLTRLFFYDVLKNADSLVQVSFYNKNPRILSMFVYNEIRTLT